MFVFVFLVYIYFIICAHLLLQTWMPFKPGIPTRHWVIQLFQSSDSSQRDQSMVVGLYVLLFSLAAFYINLQQNFNLLFLYFMFQKHLL